jgi:hypothetical protein
MHLLLWFVGCIAVVLGSLWLVYRVFQDPTGKIHDARTGAEMSSGCAIPGALPFGGLAAFMAYEMAPDIAPRYRRRARSHRT